MRKGSSNSSKPQFLPSLLDRVTDDNYISSTLESSRQRVNALEKKLSNKDVEVTEQQKKEWLEELKTQRGQLLYLQQSIGTLDKIMDVKTVGPIGRQDWSNHSDCSCTLVLRL